LLKEPFPFSKNKEIFIKFKLYTVFILFFLEYNCYKQRYSCTTFSNWKIINLI